MRRAHQTFVCKPTVMKFGGTSVEDTAAFRNVTSIVKVAAASRPVVVVSAIGGFTNTLLQSVEQAIAGDGSRRDQITGQGL